MIKHFEEISDSARIWIYQSDRSLQKKELASIQKESGQFISRWAAHGQDLLASATILYDHFLIIAADEGFNMASGCSIDTQFRFVQELGQKMHVDFFNRMNIAFLKNDMVELIPSTKLHSEIENGNIKHDSAFFDNSISTKGDLKSIWLKKAGDSWLSRYFKSQNSVI